MLRSRPSVQEFLDKLKIPSSLYASHKDNYKPLEQETEKKVNKAFSLKCLVFSLPGSQCSECRQLLELYNTKMQCREKRVSIHLKCNKEYLRKEVVLQVHQEQKRRFNAEKRERYWREKFENESVEVQNDDNSDLTCIFQGVVKEKVPEETACLWEQLTEENFAYQEQAWLQVDP